MTEIRFYHLQRQKLEQALPLILSKAIARGHRAQVLAGSAERLAALDTHLWTYDPASFLPHGTADGGNAADQPVLLTTEDENLNGADVLVLVDGAQSDRVGAFPVVCEIFDGIDEAAVAAARARWKSYAEAGHALVYYQQDEKGHWVEKTRSPAASAEAASS